MRLGTPLSPTAVKVMLLGSGELGKEVAIELQRLGCEVIAVDRYPDAPAMFDDRTQDQPADAAEAIDGDANGHLDLLLAVIPKGAHGGPRARGRSSGRDPRRSTLWEFNPAHGLHTGGPWQAARAVSTHEGEARSVRVGG